MAHLIAPTRLDTPHGYNTKTEEFHMAGERNNDEFKMLWLNRLFKRGTQ